MVRNSQIVNALRKIKMHFFEMAGPNGRFPAILGTSKPKVNSWISHRPIPGNSYLALRFNLFPDPQVVLSLWG